MFTSTPQSAILLASVFLTASVGFVQAADQPESQLELVDQGVTDRDELATSLRVLFDQPNAPTRFARLYQTPLAPGQLVRIDGGVAAVFPRSEYFLTRKQGEIPVVPAGTVFLIGGVEQLDSPLVPDPWTPPPGSTAELLRVQRLAGLRAPTQATPRLAGAVSDSSARRPDRPNAIYAISDRSARRSAATAQLERVSDVELRVPTVFTDESHRRTRLRELLQQALDESRGPEELGADQDSSPKD